MNIKREIYIVLIFLVLISISAVSASDDSTSDIISADNSEEIILDESINEDLSSANDNELILDDSNVDELVGDVNENPILNAGKTGSFTDLNATINGNEANIINLTQNYTFNDTSDSAFYDGIVINRSLTINGKGNTIKANNISRIFNIEADYVVFNNIKFIDCDVYNNAINWLGDNGSLLDCEFTNCSSFSSSNNQSIACYGGAIYWSGANAVISDCSFVNCSANSSINDSSTFISSTSYGGAIYLSSINASVVNSSFANCSANSCNIFHSARLQQFDYSNSYGGAIYWSGGAGSLVDCDFVDCTAYAMAHLNDVLNISDSRYGGAIYWSGEDAYVNTCNFTNNTAVFGGAIFFTNAATVNNSIFEENTVEKQAGNNQNLMPAYGGAIYFADGAVVNNSIFYKNMAIGDFYNPSEDNEDNSHNGGGALYIEGEGYVTNSIFNKNEAIKGAAIYSSGKKQLEIRDCEFLENKGSVQGKIGWSMDIFKGCTFVLQPGNNFINAIYMSRDNISFSNVTYWNGKIVNTDDGYPIKYFLCTEFNLTVTDGEGNILHNEILIPIGTSNVTFNQLWELRLPEEPPTIFNLTVLEDDYNKYFSMTLTIPLNETRYHTFVYFNTTETEFNYNDCYINFSVVNQSEYIDVVITNEDGDIVFEKTIRKEFNPIIMVEDYNELLFVDLPANDRYYNMVIYNRGTFNSMPSNASKLFKILRIPSQISLNTTSAFEGDDVIVCYDSIGAEGVNVISIKNATSTLIPGTDYAIKSAGDGKVIITGLGIGAYTIELETIPDENHTSVSTNAALFVKTITSFSALQDLINHATDSITLERNYKFDPAFDSELINGIVINKDIIIYGAGFTLDGNNQASIFKVTNGANATIRDLTLQNGYAEVAGGAIWNNATLAVINITFDNNEGYNGGAFYNNLSCYATIDNSSFINNNGSAGGAISNVGTLVVDNSVFDNNIASNKGGAISNYRGTLTLLNSNLTNNAANLNGGAIASDRGITSIDNSFICNNTAKSGGGVYAVDALTMNNSALQSNSAIDGSALWANNGENIVLKDVRFVDNGDNAIFSNNGDVDTSQSRFLTAVVFEIADIDDFVNGSTILVQVRETLKGESFNGIVAFSIGGFNFSLDIVNGVGSMNVTPDLSFGKYAVKLSFDETDVYYKAFAESNQFQVSNKPLLSVEDISNFVTGSSVTIKLTAIDTFNGVVNVLIDGVNYAVDLVNGGGSKTLTLNLKAGLYNATINYPGNENFTADYVVSNAFTVSKKPTVITASAVTATYNVNKYLVATLKDNAGKLLTGVKVTIKLSNGKTYSKTTDNKGQVKLLVSNLLPKAYTATITFAGNDYYAKATKSAKVTVKKATPKMTAKAKTFKVKVKVKKYTVTLKTNRNKVMKNTKVTLKVNKKTFTAKTNKKGIATFKITNLKKKGKFTAVIKYAGSKYYNKLTKKAKITVKK